jgi:hypothetical protein
MTCSLPCSEGTASLILPFRMSKVASAGVALRIKGLRIGTKLFQRQESDSSKSSSEDEAHVPLPCTHCRSTLVAGGLSGCISRDSNATSCPRRLNGRSPGGFVAVRAISPQFYLQRYCYF